MGKAELHTTTLRALADRPKAGSRRRAVLLFARSPRSEAAAKRIAGLDYGGRLKLFTALTRQAVRTASESGCDLIVASDSDSPIFRKGAVHTIRQRGTGFGDRLLNAIRDTFALGYDDVAAFGNDSPELRGETIREMLIGKAPGSIELCRAADGGFTVIAVDRETEDLLPELFGPSRWESSHLVDDLVENARRAGIRVNERAGGNDLDSRADLIRLADSSSAPRELRRIAFELSALVTYRPSSVSYIRPHRRTLRTCRQKAPPLLPFQSV